MKLLIIAAFAFGVHFLHPSSLKMSDHQKDVIEAFESSAQNTVYKVYIQTDQGVVGTGTGFVVKYKDHLYFVTNSHVCMPEPAETVVDVGEDKKLMAGRKRSIKSDLCAARINHLLSVPYLNITTTAVKPGEFLYTVGYPAGEYGSALLQYRREEIQPWIAGFKVDHEDKAECNPFDEMLFGNALTEMCVIHETPMGISKGLNIPGASGSPVFNEDGDVVGVIAGTSGEESMFVPVSQLIEFLETRFSK